MTGHLSVRDGHRVQLPNGKVIGEVYREVDGYYVFCFSADATAGFWAASYLREVADLLDEMNAEWDAEVRRGLEELERRERD